MRKLLSLMLIVLIGALLVVSCNDSPTPTPPSPSDPTYTPTLTSYNAKEVFEKGISLADAKDKGYLGSLKYQDEKGNVETISVKESADVQIKGFDAATETADDEVRTLTFQYKGLSVTAKYKVFELQIPAVKGTFVIGKNQTVTLDTTDPEFDTVITTYDNYMRLYNNVYGDYTEGVHPKHATIEYAFIADTNRVKIVIKTEDQSFRIALESDGDGGLKGHVQAVDLLEPHAETVYVNTEKFNRYISPAGFGDKWLAFQFVDNAGLPMEKTVYVWNFYLLDKQDSDLPAQPTFQITADQLSFDVSGVYVDRDTNVYIEGFVKNFKAGPNRDSTYTDFKALSVVSSSDDTWKGYSGVLFPREEEKEEE